MKKQLDKELTPLEQIRLRVDKSATPKEKATELTQKYWLYSSNKEEVKQCALILAEEFIADYRSRLNMGNVDFYKETNPIAFWMEVKEEIEKL